MTILKPWFLIEPRLFNLRKFNLKTVLLIDGGYLRASAKSASKTYDNHFIEKFAESCFDASEYKFRVLYYDSPLYRGKAKLPVSGKETNFSSSDQWLKDLAKLERFAVRQGTVGFRGWKPKSVPIATAALTDADFSPIFEQKGVDMRVGLDIATLSSEKLVERIILVSGDTDMTPAMKHARKNGIEVGVIQLQKPTYDLHETIIIHSDFVRNVKWP